MPVPPHLVERLQRARVELCVLPAKVGGGGRVRVRRVERGPRVRPPGVEAFGLALMLLVLDSGVVIPWIPALKLCPSAGTSGAKRLSRLSAPVESI